jgi:hypothetical protein
MRTRVAVAALFLLISATVRIGAQAQQPSDLLVLSVIDVKPDLLSEFGELQAQAMAAQRKGGQPWRETWNVLQFGDPHRVRVVRPLASFAELDGQTFTVKGAGAEQARVINERSRRMIVAQQIYAVRVRPDLGFGERPEQPNLAVLATVFVTPGRNAEFEAIVKNDVIPAYKKAGQSCLGMAQVIVGGDPNMYFAMTFYSDFADVQKGSPLLRALGPVGFAKYNAKLAGVISRMEFEVIRFNPALSFMAR